MGTRTNRLLNPPPGHEEVQISSKIPVAARDEIKTLLAVKGLTMQEFIACAVLDALDEMRLTVVLPPAEAPGELPLLASNGIASNEAPPAERTPCIPVKGSELAAKATKASAEEEPPPK